jgi:hypothetical protein
VNDESDQASFALNRGGTVAAEALMAFPDAPQYIRNEIPKLFFRRCRFGAISFDEWVYGPNGCPGFEEHANAELDGRP